MSYCLMPPEVLRVGEPTPFALRDKTGCLLVPRGTLVASEPQRQLMVARDLYIEDHEGELVKRALAGKIHTMVQNNALLGQIAHARANSEDLAAAFPKDAPPRRRLADPAAAWTAMVSRTGALLRDGSHTDYDAKTIRLQQHLMELLDSDADNALLLLVQATVSDFHDYSATHAVLVAVICELAARHLPGFDAGLRSSLRCAALTMNIAMTVLQNQLALQDETPSSRQRAQIADHAARGVAQLRAGGVADELWLDAVEHHHDADCGNLTGRPTALQLARLLQRADIFAARLSPRKRRSAMSGCAAARAAFLGEDQQPDEAGAAIVKATGIYPPGSLVRLSCGEIAVVLRRGRRANEPEVASVVSAHGTPLAVPSLRNTRMKPYDVVGAAAPHEVKLRMNVTQLLKLA